jgi:hypothetical protein
VKTHGIMASPTQTTHVYTPNVLLELAVATYFM